MYLDTKSQVISLDSAMPLANRFARLMFPFPQFKKKNLNEYLISL